MEVIKRPSTLAPLIKWTGDCKGCEAELQMSSVGIYDQSAASFYTECPNCQGGEVEMVRHPQRSL